MVEDASSFWTEIQRFENMLEEDPLSLSFAPLSELYRKLGLLDDAILVAQKGCALHPDFQGGFLALGGACIDKGLNEEARVALERAVELNPEHMHAKKLLARLYVEAGETALAQEILEELLQRDSEDAESLLMLQSLASLAGTSVAEEDLLEEAEVIEDLTELFDEPPQPASASVSDSSLFETRNPPALAYSADNFGFAEIPEETEDAELLEPLDAREPAPHISRDPLTTATLAELYVSQGFLEKAIAIYQELLAADPGNHAHRLRFIELKGVLERQLHGGVSPEPVFAESVPAEPLPFEAPPGVEEFPPVEEPVLSEPVRQAQEAAVSEPEPPVQEATASGPEPPVQEAAVSGPGLPVQETTASEPDLPPETPVTAHAGVAAELEHWLENIRRRRDGV